jgi:hypothetical protein
MYFDSRKIAGTLIVVTDAPIDPYSPYHLTADGIDVYASRDSDLEKLLRKLIQTP